MGREDGQRWVEKTAGEGERKRPEKGREDGRRRVEKPAGEGERSRPEKGEKPAGEEEKLKAFDVPVGSSI
jgi:hypothetical protein